MVEHPNLLRQAIGHKPAWQAFPFGFGARKDQGTGFSVLAAQEMERELKYERGGRGRGRKEGFLTFLPHPIPALLLKPFFARSLFFAPKPRGNACYAVIGHRLDSY